MKLFNPSKNKKEALAIDEAYELFYKQLIDTYNDKGWKYFKSQRCLKKTIKDLVFQINFYTSKWNSSFENIEIQSECQIWSKSFDKKLNVHSQVGYYKFKPNNGNDWYSILHKEEIEKVIDELVNNMNNTIIKLTNMFETDFIETIKTIASDEQYDIYHFTIKFIDTYVGRNYINRLTKKCINSLNEDIRKDIERYKNGAKDTYWMINPTDLKYLIDNNIV
ncbi:MAG: hypothetical protein ACK5LC_06775 [Coprobacillaceae bacterium]